MDQSSMAYQEAANRLATAVPGMRRAAVDALITLAAADAQWRQPVTDTICSWLCTPAGPDDGAIEERRAVLHALTHRLRTTGQVAAWDGISVDLSGAVLVDADFGGCRLDGAGFADTRSMAPRSSKVPRSTTARRCSVRSFTVTSVSPAYGSEATPSSAGPGFATGGLHRYGVRRDGLVRPGRLLGQCHAFVGRAMMESARCIKRNGDPDRAASHVEAVLVDFEVLLDEFEVDAPYDEHVIALEYLLAAVELIIEVRGSSPELDLLRNRTTQALDRALTD